MCISGEKFEEPCSNISGDILDSVELFMMSSLSLFAKCKNMNNSISKMQKRHSKRENSTLLYYEKSFKYAATIFYFIGTSTGEGAISSPL